MIKPLQVRVSSIGTTPDSLELRLKPTQGAEEAKAAMIHGTNTSLIPWALDPAQMIDLHVSNPWLGAIKNLVEDAISSARIEVEPLEYDESGQPILKPDPTEYARIMAWLHRPVIATDGELKLNLSGFLRVAASHWDATGNLFLEVVRSSNGLNFSRFAFLYPQFVWYERSDTNGVELVQRDPLWGEYRFKPFGTRKTKNDAREFLHDRLPNLLSSVYGLPAWITARDSIALDNAHRAYLKTFFKNHGTPRWMFTITQDPTWLGVSPLLEDLEKLHTHISSYLSANAGNMAGRNMILQYPGGIIVKAEALDHKLEDPTFQKLIGTARDEILATRHISMIDLGLPEGGYRATASEQSNNFRDHMLQPHIAPALRCLNAVISSDAPFGLSIKSWRIVAKFDKAEEALKKYETLLKAVGTAFLTINEGRQLAGFEPVDGGDELLTASNLIPLEDLSEITEEETLEPAMTPQDSPIPDNAEPVAI